MRSGFALFVCFVWLSGCAGVRQHWADGIASLWHHNCHEVAKHGPEFAGAVAEGVVEDAADRAIYPHESTSEREARQNAEFFGHY